MASSGVMGKTTDKSAQSIDTVPNFLAQGHDHEACMEDALADAERVCEAAGANLTTLRKQVLRIVWSGHRPVGAYEIL